MAGSNVLDMAVMSPLFGCPIVCPSPEDRVAAADFGLSTNGRDVDAGGVNGDFYLRLHFF